MPPVPLLSARGLKKSFGGRLILDGLDLELADGMRVGVLGPNGGGKSTLLAILAGLEEPDDGTVTRRRGLVHAFLPQHVPGDDRTPLAWVSAARPELAALEDELHAVERRLADPALAHDLDAMGRALARQERLLAQWAEMGGDRAEGEARGLLDELGVPDEALTMPTSELSGGQRKLVALAACLARRPQVLMLDEPEAHLDMRRRDQLERIVDDFDGAVLMVSHDRHLLDACVGAIAELDGGRIRIWPGGYSAYAVARQLELEKQQQQFVTQQRRSRGWRRRSAASATGRTSRSTSATPSRRA
jgi:ATP-binding cassette subfamily F protein 3